MNDDPQTGILSKGDVLNNTYVIADLVASGGTGEVYRATNRVSGREIAVKILKREFAQNEQFIRLMKREAEVLHEVIDPAVVRYYDLLESDLHGGFLFIVMEFINGQSLADEMIQNGPVAPDVLLKVAERVLRGLKAAHDKKAFHRDLSPDNIILRDGDPEQATLIDFGIAKDVNEGAKTIVGGGFAGKYQYASPEQMEGRADARSDLYSLGMTLLGAYRGQAPLSGSSMLEIVKAKAEKPDLSDMDGTLRDLVDNLVEPNPDMRLQTADEALRYLAAAANGPMIAGVPVGDGQFGATVVSPLSVPPTSIPPHSVVPPAAPAPVQTGGRGGLWAVLVVLLLAAGGGGAYFAGLLDPYLNGDDPVTADGGPTQTAPGTDTPPTGQPPERTDTATNDTPTGDTPSGRDQSLPLADPYRLTVERTSTADPLRVIGNLPSADRLPAITRDLEESLDTFAVLADVTAARGEPFDGWTDRVVGVAKVFAALDAFTVAAEGTEVVLIAKAENDAEKNALLAAAWQVIEGSGLNIVDRITVAPPELTLQSLAQGLGPMATCGPLRLSGGTGGAIGPSDTIRVAGNVATAADRTSLAAFLRQAAPGRAVESNTQVVNPGVCDVLALLPAQTSEAMSIAYSYGTKDGEVQNDTFHLGENPVVDVMLPASREGFLHVVFVDLAEQVFHLLPHQARTEAEVQKIGTVDNGWRKVRVAFPIADASIEQLGFKVVEPLGVNIVLAVVTDEPLFADLRPRAESNAAFIEALNGRLASVIDNGGLLTWRFLRTDP